MTKRRLHAEPRKRWTREDEQLLRELYPDTKSQVIADRLRCTVSRIYQKAANLGLSKSAAYLASPDACRLRRGDHAGIAYRYPKGHVPANKGLRRPGYAPGRMRETQFAKGQLPHNADPDFYVLGALRVDTEGYIQMRVSFEQGGKGWRYLHRILWEDAHGPIPRGYILTFKDRERLNVELDNLELISMADNARRNRMHGRLPADLVRTIHALGTLKRAITMRNRREEQDRGSAQSPVRHPRGAARSR